jgi:hypothetical protein
MKTPQSQLQDHKFSASISGTDQTPQNPITSKDPQIKLCESIGENWPYGHLSCCERLAKCQCNHTYVFVFSSSFFHSRKMYAQMYEVEAIKEAEHVIIVIITTIILSSR